MLKIGTSSLNAADLVAVLGRNALALRTTLANLADGSQALGDALDPALTGKLKSADDTFKIFGQTVEIRGARVLDVLTKIGNVAKYIFPEGWLIDKAAGTPLETTRPPVRKFPTPDDETAPVGVSSGDYGEPGGAGGESDEDRLSAAYEKQYTDALGPAQKLEEIDVQRGKLQDRLNELAAIGGGEDGEETKIKLQLVDLDTQRGTIQDQINASLDEQGDKEFQAQKDAAQATEDAQERNEELYQELQGHDDIAAQLKIEYDFNQKINQAISAGNTDLAEQLETEKQLTLEKQKQAQAEEDEKDALDAYNHAAGVTSNTTNALRLGGATSADLSGLPKSLALAQSGFVISQQAIALATDPATGQISDEALAAQIVQYNQETNFGQNNLGWQQQLAADKAAQNVARTQGAQVASDQQRAALLSSITAPGGGGLDAAFSGQLFPLLQAILTRLDETHEAIKPGLPGSV
ncbi:MAG TPA: hypothetical protein VHW03_01965 [Chthoniobacterales bacterium]|nr:hypothetical protein [Chthoniobacterales bacterium]